MTETTETPRTSSRWADLLELPPPMAGLVLVVAAAAVVARFAIRTPLWLDEALSVDIAHLPLSKIPGALRHDGHPPLYYVLLHFWMAIVGTGDTAVRSLSGGISLLAVAPVWAVGRRLGGARIAATLVVVYLLSPFALRYGSETRMYSLVLLLVWCGMAVVERSLARPRGRDVAAVAVISALLLWSHYWSMWLLAGFGVGLVARWWRLRRDDPHVTRSTAMLLGGVVIGALTFVPWVPTLLYQSAHTGTPWAPSFRPSTLIVSSLVAIAGGPSSEVQVAAYVAVLLAVLGVLGVRRDRRSVLIEMSPAADARRSLTMLALTTAIASAAGLATGTAFAPRYAAVYVAFYLVLIALGLSRFAPGPVRTGVVAVFLAACLVGLVAVFVETRTQAAAAATSLARVPGGATVVACPDQLGPSLSRALGGRYEVRVFPPHDDPRFVDWVDYEQRIARADPTAFADAVLASAADRPVAVVSSDAYKTFGDKCRRVEAALAAHRPVTTLLVADPDAFEPMWVHLYAPAG